MSQFFYLIAANFIKLLLNWKGKVQATNCLWVGGLTEKSRKQDLAREFEYFALSTTQKSISHHHEPAQKQIEIDWRPEQQPHCAFILFNTISQAEEARIEMRGKTLPNRSSERLRIDYADPKRFKIRFEFFSTSIIW